MNCNEIQAKISEWIDEGLQPPEEVQVRRHLELCQPCSVIYEDLNLIRKSTQALEELEPNDRIWAGLRSQLLSEGLIRQSARVSFWERVFPRGSQSFLKPALSGAIVALILVGVSYLYFRAGRPGPSDPVSREVAVFQQLRKAELHYQQAIQALDEVSHLKLDTLDPALAQIFQDNLATMDYYLDECKKVVKSDPDNPLAHRYLLAAYQKKVELMQTLVNSDSL